ncbi:hypothetical protein NT6N_09350 [Oceaniferula spumae]|uniref:PEP-CTERM protein-sorting domain-containing protein n=1 Tax=Oceaniferula spumae TaxID=2979115 RepID=A0AAT9FIY7_9BACT
MKLLISATALLMTGGLASAALVTYSGDISDARTIGSVDSLRQTDSATILVGGSVTVTSASTTNATIGQLAAGSFTIDGGSLSVDVSASFLLGNGNNGNGIVTLIDGSFTANPTGTFFIGRDNASGLLTISGGTANFGVAPTFDNTGGNGTIDFTLNSAGTLTIAGADESYYQNLYDTTNDLTYDGGNTAAFADVFVVNGSTLSLVPEPSSMALLLGGAGVLLLRRRRC